MRITLGEDYAWRGLRVTLDEGSRLVRVTLGEGYAW